MHDQELELFLKENIVRIEDYLLAKRLLVIVYLGNIEIKQEHINNKDVEVYITLKMIYASYPNRD